MNYILFCFRSVSKFQVCAGIPEVLKILNTSNNKKPWVLICLKGFASWCNFGALQFQLFFICENRLHSLTSKSKNQLKDGKVPQKRPWGWWRSCSPTWMSVCRNRRSEINNKLRKSLKSVSVFLRCFRVRLRQQHNNMDNFGMLVFKGVFSWTFGYQ